MAAERAIPAKYFAQILGLLAKAGQVRSVPGRAGYLLRTRAGRLSLLEVTEAVEGPVHPW